MAKNKSKRVSSTFSHRMMMNLDVIARSVGINRTTYVTAVVVQDLMEAMKDGRIPPYLPHLIDDLLLLTKFIRYFILIGKDYDDGVGEDSEKIKHKSESPTDIDLDEDAYLLNFLDNEVLPGEENPIILSDADIERISKIIGISAEDIWSTFFESED